MANSLSNRALLVSLSISQWSARKYDKRETAALALKHGVDGVARVNKALLPMADSLDAIHKKTNAIRGFFDERTLPWGLDGMHIISTQAYVKFASDMGTMMADWRTLVREFLRDYPALKEDARRTMNGLYREEDYPDVYDLERKFGIDTRFFPVPDTKDLRIDLADEHMAVIREKIERDVRSATGDAMGAAWKRVAEVVQRARERLSDPKNVFRDTLVENARDLCRVLTDLNLTDDPNLERVRQELEGSLCAYHPDTLRHAQDVRAEVARKMADIEDKFGFAFAA